MSYAKNREGNLESEEKSKMHAPQVPPRPREGSADPRVAGESIKVDPAEGGFEQQDGNRSICESDAGKSNKSSSGKARVAKVTRGSPQPVHTMDAKQRLAAMGKDAFLKDMEERRIAAFSKGRARQEALLKDTEEA